MEGSRKTAERGREKTPVQLDPVCLGMLHPPLRVVGISIGMERECQQNDSLANGKAPV